MKRGACGRMEWEDDTMLLWERKESCDLVDEFYNVDLLPPFLQTHTKTKSLGNPPKSDNLPCNATKQEQLENTNHNVLIKKEKSAELGMEWLDEKMEYEMDDTDWLLDDFFMEQIESESHNATTTNVSFDWVLDLESKGLFSNIDNCLGQSQCESSHINADKKEEINLGFNGAIVPCRARTKRPRARADMGEVCHEESSASMDLSLMKNDMKKSKKRKKGISQPRRCTHCLTQKTPQWRMGPLGPKSLCNACGVRFKSGRLFPEYRPAKSPAYQSFFHSNSHKKVMEMRGQIQDAL